MLILEFITTDIIFSIIIALFSGLIRGYTGFASGLLLIPLFVILFGPIEGIALAAIVSSAGGVQLIPSALKSVYWPELGPALIGAILFVFFSVFILISSDPLFIKRMMGILLLFAAVVLMTGWTYRGPRNVFISLLAGSFSGAGLGAFGLPAGQFLALYFITSPKNAEIQRANITVCAGMTVFFLLASLLFHNQVNFITIQRSLVLIPIFVIGTWLGLKLFNRLPLSWFSSIVHILILFTGLSLLFT